jgi:DNA-directed RNA polymerase subunit RPC12/RpoP
MAKAICANCSAPISLGADADAGQSIACSQCQASLKLVSDGEYLLTIKTA